MGPESVHLDKYGTVLKNVDDGDKGIYVHENAKTEADVNKTYSAKNTDAGGEKIGELGGSIDANKIFGNLLSKNIDYAKGIINPLTFKKLVKGQGDWDFKNNSKTIFGLVHNLDKGKEVQTQFSFDGRTMMLKSLVIITMELQV